MSRIHPLVQQLRTDLERVVRFEMELEADIAKNPLNYSDLVRRFHTTRAQEARQRLFDTQDEISERLFSGDLTQYGERAA